MKLFDIKKSELFYSLLFALLFALIEGASAIALAATSAMFLSGVGVDGIPVSYVFLFIVMLAVTAGLAAAQSKISLDRVFRFFFGGFGVFVAVAIILLLFVPSGSAASKILLYILFVMSSVWTYASYTLYWNFADERFSIREGKRLYSMFSAAGWCGAIAGAGVVFIVSEYAKLDTRILLWGWVGCAFLLLPVIKAVNKRKSKLDSGIDLEGEGVGSVLRDSIKEMRSSSYVKTLFRLFLLLIAASAICEFSSMSAFSEYANAKAAHLGGDTESVARTTLASLFGALGVGVNVFNLAVNLLLFNKIVSRIGVGNLALLQPALFIAAFIWMINSFGIEVAIFSFFLYRGTIECIDGNNENLMISVLPSSIRQNVRLIIETFIVPFSTALAGVFLMIFATPSDIEAEESSGAIAEFFSSLGVGTLSQTQISAVGLILGVAAMVFAVMARAKYPKVLERNLRSGWLDFSKTLGDIINKDVPADEEFEISPNETASKILSVAEAQSYVNPVGAVEKILNNSAKLAEKNSVKAGEILRRILSHNDYSARTFALKWLYANSLCGATFALNAISSESDSEPEKMILPDSDEAISGKTTIDDFLRGANTQLAERVTGLLTDPKLSQLALSAFAKVGNPRIGYLSKKLASRFKNSDDNSRIFIANALLKMGLGDALETMFLGVSQMSTRVQREVLNILEKSGKSSVPFLISILKSSSFSYCVKSICAQALTKAFPSQIKSIDLASDEIKAAHIYAAQARVLSKAQDCYKPLAIVRAAKSRQALLFAILIHSLSGRIPPFEIVESALFASGGKERGNAIESLSEKLPRSDFKMLLPLIDGRSPEQLANFTTSEYGNLGEMSIGDIIHDAISSGDEEDFLASISAMISFRSPNLDLVLCEKIGAEKFGYLRDSLLSLLDEIAMSKFVDSAENFKFTISYPQKFAALSMCGAFDGFEPQALVALARCARELKDIVDCDCIIVSSSSEGVGDASARYASYSDKILPTDIFLVPVSDIYRVASEFPEAAQSLYLEGLSR